MLCSASGSPGVTTTAIGLTRSWPRSSLLVEADPTGGSAIYAGMLQGKRAPSGGLIDLALMHRQGVALVDAIPVVSAPLDENVTDPAARWFVPGSRSHVQAPTLAALWEPLAAALKELEESGQDVIVDAGRLGLAGWPEPLVQAADLALLVTGNSLPALAAARSWASALREDMSAVGAQRNLGLLVIDESARWPATQAGGVPRVRPHSARQASKVLGLPVIATVPWDPSAADVYSHGARAPRKWEAAALPRAFDAAAAGISATIRHTADELAVPASATRWLRGPSREAQA